SQKLSKFLKRSGIKYAHLNRYIKDEQLLVKNLSLEQYDEGFNWLRRNYQNIDQDGVVYLARIQTSYEPKVFELMRQTKKVMVWPVGLVNNSLYTRPVCIDQRVVSWFCPWKCEDDLYPIHESAFAINLKLLVENGNQMIGNHRKHGDFFVTYFLKSFVSMEELEA
ncbi:galactosylgalactosylxylosyl 3-beta-glucuronosyltransferase 2-like, partial [Brachionus plicatilis]